MQNILPPSFFAREADIVALELLGKTLVRERNGISLFDTIVETEAYMGSHDLACHASRGRTPRTEVMFGPAGIWYVYFVYGMHWMLNIVTGLEGQGAAVLIRGVSETTGPARLTKRFDIDRSFNAVAATRKHGLWLEDRGRVVESSSVKRTPRIGVDYAGKWAREPLRFVLNDRRDE